MIKKNILVIDDEPDTLTYFTSLLEDNGYSIVKAENGSEAIKKLAEMHFDLITLDITMPEVSGVRCYRTIKESPDWKDIPVIIVTGISDDFKTFISTRKNLSPPEGYISKPVEGDELLLLIKSLL